MLVLMVMMSTVILTVEYTLYTSKSFDFELV